MKVRFEKRHENAVIPSYSNPGDAGMDLTAVSIDVVNEVDHGYVEYDTGIAMEIPEGYVGLIYPRSSISRKGMWLSNSVGVIDSGYRGTITCRFKAIPSTSIYEVGERVAQLIIMPYPKIEFEEVNELTDSIRGEGGYGSSGN